MRPRSQPAITSRRPGGEAGCGRRSRGDRVLRRAARQDAGFTLLELSVVMFLISLLVAVAVPALKKVQLESRATAVVNDLRVYSGAFQAYVHEKGDWPAGASEPGVFPPGLEGYLRESNWTRPTPIGGRYTWAPNSLHQGQRYRAAIVIASVPGSPVTDDRHQLLDLDRKADDASLDTGNLRLGFRNYPVYVLEH